MKIIEQIFEESTCNAWGFGGATGIINFRMENGDRWRTGTAVFRHAPSERFIRAWDDNGVEIGDWALRGKGRGGREAETFINKFYDREK